MLGTVGEPINPEAWVWYWKVIGGERCPIVDTWWQTENGGILITPLPGVVTTKPGSATIPFPGIAARRSSTRMATRSSAERAASSWSSARGRACSARSSATTSATSTTYFSKYGPDVYVTGDGAKQDEDGYFWLMGRIDDVINVAGHRLSTTEIESTLVEHPAVAEAAATGAYDPQRGQRIVCFVLLKDGYEPHRTSSPDELREWVAEKIGKIARPAAVSVRRRPAQDALGQDHAAPASGTSPKATSSATRRPCVTLPSSRI